jgi:hypothetical protein
MSIFSTEATAPRYCSFRLIYTDIVNSDLHYATGGMLAARALVLWMVCRRIMHNAMNGTSYDPMDGEGRATLGAKAREPNALGQEARSGRGDGISPITSPTPPDMRFSASGG